MAKEEILIKGDVFWCNNYERNIKSRKYQIDLCNLSADAVQALARIGIEAKRDDAKKPAQGFYITCKSAGYVINTYDKTGKELGEWVKVDKGTEVKRDEQGKALYTRVSNGSKALATISPYETTVNGQRYTQGSIKKIVITDLIEYNPQGMDVSKMEEEAL
jgi:hypothetical protein